jgi:hypothetical protein
MNLQLTAPEYLENMGVNKLLWGLEWSEAWWANLSIELMAILIDNKLTCNYPHPPSISPCLNFFILNLDLSVKKAVIVLESIPWRCREFFLGVLYIVVLCTILGMVCKESVSLSMISYTMKMILNSHNGRREDHHQRQYLPSLESKKTNNKTWLHCMLTFSFILLTMIVVVQVGKNHQSHLFLMTSFRPPCSVFHCKDHNTFH